jgi:hypothetical protein
VDIHPEPEHACVQVRSGRTRHALGHLDDTAYIRDIHAGRAVVEALIQQKLFVRERTAGFTSVLHVSDVDTWLAYRAERASRSLLAPQLIERARDYLAQDEGEILIVTHGHAARLRRL